MPGRCPTRAAGRWAGPARSTRWPTSAATARSTTPGPPAARPGGDTRTCCRTSSAARTPQGRDPALRGTGGPVRVAPVPETGRHPAALAFAEALCALGCPASDDLSGRRQEGVAWPDLAIAGGRRVSPADAYLRPAPGPPEPDRPGPAAWSPACSSRTAGAPAPPTCATATRQQAHASAEVIVCAGAVGSPQLLMLSGIGPAGHLRDSASTRSPTCPGSERTSRTTPPPWPATPRPRRCRASRYNHGETYAALPSPLAGAWPDLHLFPDLAAASRRPAARPRPAASPWWPAVIAPDSRGSVRLASANPAAPPLIDPGFLREPADLDRLEAGLAVIRHAAAGAAFARLGVTEAWPGPGVRDGDGLRDWIRRTVGSYYHPAGTCRIGPSADDGAVTDPELRVHGISRAAGRRRVGDAGHPERPPARHRARHRRACRRPDHRPVAEAEFSPRTSGVRLP